ncbi:hypothetical protein [Paenibacillus durus]|uniref:Uncharacterized protein n=1 Tax=Paenibacillus durus ATCC 35681 TaxID=1333534 RepID=A0A0F7FAH9_PAEDU|nr:hypothetical protein [Paenibacillus durus]AKG35639.1 hypothetical protein VK70_14520 [Paenibacillus durus ATCC 35681]
MTRQTNEELRSDIAELTERIRQIRIEQGLPTDPLPRPEVVEPQVAAAIVHRLAPFKAIAVKLAAILAQGQLPRIDVSKLEKYREYGRMLNYSYGMFAPFYASGVHSVFCELERINAAIDEGQTADFDVNSAMRRLHFDISALMEDRSISQWGMYDKYGGSYTEERKAAEAEMKRLIADDEAFQAAYSEALTQLPTKEEDDLYE